MAVAVLDRTAETLERADDKQKIQLKNSYTEISDEQHNAQISETYKLLINPNASIAEILKRDENRAEQAPVDVFAKKAYLVENARADSDLFRADSPVNRREDAVQSVADVREEEEENEDLVPSRTTFQYLNRSNEIERTEEDGEIENRQSEKRANLSKKEKIVIAVVVGVIVALFALIIINSAILSGINSDISALQSSLTTIKASYAGVSDEVNTMLANAAKDVEDFAVLKGLVKVGI